MLQSGKKKNGESLLSCDKANSFPAEALEGDEKRVVRVMEAGGEIKQRAMGIRRVKVRKLKGFLLGLRETRGGGT